LRAKFGADDRDRLDEFVTSVRDLEKRLAHDETRVKTPKPTVCFFWPSAYAAATSVRPEFRADGARFVR
jgi:hypothetical protein